MNERIKELVKEAGLTLVPNSKPIIYQGPMSELEKFAEMIVGECLNLVDRGGEFVSRPKLVERIKEHFGVE